MREASSNSTTQKRREVKQGSDTILSQFSLTASSYTVIISNDAVSQIPIMIDAHICCWIPVRM